MIQYLDPDKVAAQLPPVPIPTALSAEPEPAPGPFTATPSAVGGSDMPRIPPPPRPLRGPGPKP